MYYLFNAFEALFRILQDSSWLENGWEPKGLGIKALAFWYETRTNKVVILKTMIKFKIVNNNFSR